MYSQIGSVKSFAKIGSQISELKAVSQQGQSPPRQLPGVHVHVLLVAPLMMDGLCGHIPKRRHLSGCLRFFKEGCKKLLCVGGVS